MNEADPEGHLHVLPAPDLHLVIVRSDVFEVRLQDREEAPGESWRPDISRSRLKSVKRLEA